MICAIRCTIGALASSLVLLFLLVETGRFAIFEIGMMRQFLPSDTTSSPKTLRVQDSEDMKPMRFRDLRLVFMGDSVMRYQYLSLVYFLRYDRWYDTDVAPHVNNLMNAHSFHHPFHPNEDWNEFFLQSNRLLYPMEVCDCLRGGSSDADLLLERRYFYDDRYNNMVVYINMNGNETHPGRGFYGRLKPEEVFGPEFSDRAGFISGMNPNHQPDRASSAIAWEYTTWGDVIRQHIGALNVSLQSSETSLPSDAPHVLLNAGLHPNDFHHWNTVHDVTDALKEMQVSSATWKTTTFTKDFVLQQQSKQHSSKRSSRRQLDSSLSDTMMCQALHHCLNVSWIAQLQSPTSYYVDNLHFLEPIYRIFNEDFLEQIGLLPIGYESYDRSNILIPVVKIHQR
jgi:hypothetical protein